MSNMHAAYTIGRETALELLEWEEIEIIGWAKDRTWASSPSLVTARYLGLAAPGTKRGVIVASFNAG